MIPPYLKPNDKVAILAPAGKVFKHDIEEALELLKTWQLKPVLGKSIFDDFNFGYAYAGTDENRVADFQQALDDDSIAAIWCARGGYGSVKLLDYLDWHNFKQKPKWIIGYSDVTAIHNHVNNWNIASIHGITCKRLKVEYNPATFSTLQQTLFGKKIEYNIGPNQHNKLGTGTGKLVGGNLSLIYSLLGSESAIQGENLILFIEDWNENWYHVDRMLTNLKRNGLFNKVVGMLIGSFTQMDVKTENPDFAADFDEMSNKIIQHIIKEYDFPVAYNFPAGHIGNNQSLVLGSIATLSVEKNKVSLIYK